MIRFKISYLLSLSVLALNDSISPYRNKIENNSQQILRQKRFTIRMCYARLFLIVCFSNERTNPTVTYYEVSKKLMEVEHDSCQ